jgi:1,4-alpha-glucan branching enzyme
MPAPRPRTLPARKPAVRRVPFTVKIDDAREVALAADFNGWTPSTTPLRKVQEGAWSATLELPPGEYQYRLVVDGRWCDHPEAPRRVPNPYGTENCVLTVA